MSTKFTFKCTFCGMDFGTDVIKLALHIGKIHDISKTRTLDKTKLL